MRKLFIVFNVVALAVLFCLVFFLYCQNKRLESRNAELSEKINAVISDELTEKLKDRIGELSQSVESQLSRLNKLQKGVTEIQIDIPDIKSGLNNALARSKTASSDITDLEEKYKDIDVKLDKIELWEYEINKLSDWGKLKGSVENLGKYIFGEYPCDGFKYTPGLWNKSLKDQMDELINTIRIRTRY